MCGINGIFSYNRAANPIDYAELVRTRDYMAARGPDGTGEWISSNRRVGLGHRRLSILDLSEAGAQPMIGACRRLVITYNGEIYNYPELRRELEAQGCEFCTTSDTEVLLHLYAYKGEMMVNDLRGMFAFAIWNEEKHELFLARDPYGIKPLYFADDGWTFRFASQVKALIAGGRISRDPDPAGLVGFHLWGSVPEPFTLYRGIRAVPAGCVLTVDAVGPREPRAFATLSQIFATGAAHPAASAEIAGRVRNAARDSVAAHLLADVEVGLFLSAGVDSGALLGLMRDAGAGRVRAITLAFAEFRGTEEDESRIARVVADTYGAEHIVRVFDEAEFLADLPNILAAMDQPSIDGINTWFVAKAAREAGLKVALSGVGGDELLAGYSSFSDIPRWVRWAKVPGAVPGLGWLARTSTKIAGFARANPKLAGFFELGGSYPGAYLLRRGLFMPWDMTALVTDAEFAKEGLRRLAPLTRLGTYIEPDPTVPASRIAALESAQYLRNQLLRDADWAGMANSLEIRTPLVDFELLRQLAPVTPVVNGRTGKEALAHAPSRPLPPSVVTRNKTGFCVPTGRWLAGLVGAADDRFATKGAASRNWAQFVLAHEGGHHATATPEFRKFAA